MNNLIRFTVFSICLVFVGVVHAQSVSILKPTDSQVFTNQNTIEFEIKSITGLATCRSVNLDLYIDGTDYYEGSIGSGTIQKHTQYTLEIGNYQAQATIRVSDIKCGTGQVSYASSGIVKFEIRQVPDLTITSLEPTSSIDGHPVRPSLQIKNSGMADAGPFQVDWYANPATKPTPGQFGELSVRQNGLAAGESVTLDLGSYTYDAPGTYRMFAQIDTKQEVTESNEANNVFGPTNIEVNQLTISNLTPANNAEIQGNQVTLSATASSPLDIPSGEKLQLDLILDSRTVGSQESTTTPVSITITKQLPALATAHTIEAIAKLIDTKTNNHVLTHTSQSATFEVTQKLVNSSYLMLVSSLGPPFSKQGQGAILGYDARTGVFIGKFGDVCNPADLAYGPDGNLYVADNYSDGCTLSTTNPKHLDGHVKRIEGQAGKFQSDYLDTRFPEQPYFAIGGLAFGPDGKLFVSYIESDRIFGFTGPTSPNPGEFGLWEDKRQEGFVYDYGIIHPSILAVGPDNNLYVMNLDNYKILKIGSLSAIHGDVMGTFFPPEIYTGPEIIRGLDFVFGPDNNLYINDWSANTVWSFQGPNGSDPGSFISPFIAPSRPSYLAFGPDGDLYVSAQVSGSTGSARGIYHYDGTTGKSKGLFISPPYKFGPFTFSSTPVRVLNRGDFNNDGCVDLNDMNALTDAISMHSGDLAFDLNGDMSINIADARKLVLLFTNSKGAPCHSQ